MADAAAVFPDLTVIDLSRRLSGAFCARLFGDYGADVVLAEPPEGHPLRYEEPLLPDVPAGEGSLLHAYVNANKRSCVLRPDDRAGFERLIAAADVAITNDALDFDALERLKPGIVLVTITPYGLTGPLAGQPGNELTANALSSWAATQGDPGEPPLQAAAHQVGYLAGLNAYAAAVAAVFDRDRTGLGQLVDTSELEPLTLIAGPQMLVAEYAGVPPTRPEPDMLRGPIAAADGYVSLTLSGAHFWRDAMNVLGLHDLADDERFSAAAYRQQQRGVYSKRVEAIVRGWNRWDLFDTLAQIRCLVGVVHEMQDLAESPHLRDRGFLVEAPLADGRSVPFPGAPLKLSRTPWALRRPAPRLGADTQALPPAPGGAAGAAAGATAPIDMATAPGAIMEEQE